MVKRNNIENVITDLDITFHPFGMYTTDGQLKAWFGWESQVTRYGFDEDEVRQALQTGNHYKGYIWKYAED